MFSGQFNLWNSSTFLLEGSFSMPAGVILPKEIQGGAFYKNSLYLVSNIEDNVYKLNISSGELTLVLSDTYRKHDYEMEGLDFWDLTPQGMGEMHMFGNFMQAKEKALHNYKESRIPASN